MPGTTACLILELEQLGVPHGYDLFRGFGERQHRRDYRSNGDGVRVHSKNCGGSPTKHVSGGPDP